MKEESQKIDEDSFFKNLESAPFVDVPRDELPEWLNERIDKLILEFVGKPLIGIDKAAEVYRGKWNGQTVYHVWTVFSSCFFCIQKESGEYIEWSGPGGTTINKDDFLTNSKDWQLIFKIVDGEIVGEKITDKYEFPDISEMNDWYQDHIETLHNSYDMEEEPQKIDEDDFLKISETVPLDLIPFEELPERLQASINEVRQLSFTYYQLYKGEWENQTVYYSHSSLWKIYHFEDGERIYYSSIPENMWQSLWSTKMTLIFQHGDPDNIYGTL